MSSHHNTASRDRFVRKPCTPCYFGQSTQFRGCIPQKWNAVGQSREDERERTLDFRKNCRLRSVLDRRVLVLLNSDLSRLLPSLALSLSLSLCLCLCLCLTVCRSGKSDVIIFAEVLDRKTEWRKREQRGGVRGRSSRTCLFADPRSALSFVVNGAKQRASLPEARVYFWLVLETFFWQHDHG